MDSFLNKNFLNDTKIYPRKEKNNLKEFFTDYEPNINEKINIINDSINLALINLNMTNSEYISLDIESLKSMKKIDNNSLHLCTFKTPLSLYFMIILYYDIFINVKIFINNQNNIY